MRSLILISLLIQILSKNSVIEYGKEYPFDKNNSRFEFTPDKDGLLFAQILFEGSSFMNVLITNEEGGGLITDFSKPGRGLIYEIKKRIVLILLITVSKYNQRRKRNNLD